MSGDWHKVGNVKGADGVGVPRGGARGDVLKKEGGADHATSWGKVSYADIEGKVPAAALPEISLEPYVVDSEAAMLNLPAVPGRQAIRTDIGATFVLAQAPASTLGNWIEMVSRSDVTSVNSKTGAVVLTKADLGLENVNNTADSDKPLATTSVPGLMPHTDKAKLDDATSSASASRLVQRDSSGRFNVQPPTSGPHPTTKTYVDDEVNRLVAGRTPLSGSAMQTNWDNLGTTSQAAVVEGFPIGAPAGIVSAINGLGGPWDYFVEDPVWEMRHESLGLTYRKQTARLLACDPAYMVGFAWERIYNPATGKWTDWACVAGDTGWIPSVPSISSWKNNRDVPFVYKPAHLYSQSETDLPLLRRTPHAVTFRGAFTLANEGQASGLSGSTYSDMPTFGWVPTYNSGNSGGGIWGPHADYGNERPIGVMTGSATNTWSAYFTTPTGTKDTDIGGYRYGPGGTGRKPYLPIRASWDPPQVKTWRGYTSTPALSDHPSTHSPERR